ncbi:meiotically up-regulated gene 113-domain-containing protein [Aspergillus desertorum]
MSAIKPSGHTQQARAPSMKTILSDHAANAASGYPTPPSSPLQVTTFISLERPEQDDSRSSAETGVQTTTNAPESVQELNTERQKPVAADAPISLHTLQTRLGLQSWQCGGLKPDKSPCRLTISVSKKRLVNSQLKSMTARTQKSERLQTQLTELIDLVHCRWHKHGPARENRLAAWEACFSSLGVIPMPIEPFEDQIRSIWDSFSTKCIAFTSESKRCTYSIGGWRVTNCEKTIEEIIKSEIYLNNARLGYYLKVLESNMRCPKHLKSPFVEVARWKSRILEIRNTTLPIPSNADDSPTLGGLRPDAEVFAQKGKRPSTPREDHKSASARLEKTTEPLPPEFAKDPLDFWPMSKNRSRLDIVSRSEKPGDALDLSLIQRVLVMPLGKREQEHGYVYAYEVEGHKGFVKIGFTSQTVEERLERWEFNCNRALKCLYPNSPDNTMIVPNAHRVEKLCHAELRNHMVRIYCDRCRQHHLEWFETSSEKAVAVIQKWTRWMRTGPYESIQRKSSVKWDLKEEEIGKTTDMHKFMQELPRHSESR